MEPKINGRSLFRCFRATENVRAANLSPDIHDLTRLCFQHYSSLVLPPSDPRTPRQLSLKNRQTDMPSLSNTISYLCLKLCRYQSYLSSAESTDKFVKSHYLKADHSPSQKLHRFYDIQRGHCRGRDVYTMQTKQHSSLIFTHSVNILYIHGGAYVNEITARQWEFLGHIVDLAAQKGINVIFTIPIYAIITPDIQSTTGGHGHAHAVLGFLKAVYRSVCEKSSHRDDIQIMGDEAGGGLAYALAVALDNRSGLPPPRRLILLSPWLDNTLQNPAVKRLQHADPTNRLDGLKECGRLFARGTNPQDPLLSPLYARVDKSLLARIYVWTSDADICHADVQTLVYLASKKGIDMTKETKAKVSRHTCMSGLYPSWMMASWTPEAKRTIGEIVRVIKQAATTERSPTLGGPELVRRKSSTSHAKKNRSWSRGSVNARPRGKSVQGVWGTPEVMEGVLIKEPLPCTAAVPKY